MKMISPTNREVDIGQTLGADEYIGMVRREVMDGFMRDRAIEKVTLFQPKKLSAPFLFVGNEWL